MIPATAAIALANSLHYNVHVKAAVFRADHTTGPSFTEIESRFIRATITASMDDGARRISATFDIGTGVDSFSPLLAGALVNTPAPLFATGGEFRLDIAITAPGVPPTDADYVVRELVRIDAWDTSTPGEITISGRDLGSAVYLDTFIEEPRRYGNNEAVELAMQDILVDWLDPALTAALPGTFGLDVPVSPGWILAAPGYAQQEQPVLEALRTLALQIGWDLRTHPTYIFGPTGTVLRFYDPGRVRTEPDAIFTKSEYIQITTLGVDDADVRNVVEVFYNNQTTRDRVHVEDATSIAQYGRRFMRISEDANSNIDTLTEATTLADAALADLKDPLASHTITLPLWPFVELNDLQRYVANDVLYDSDQQFAVIGYTHQIEKGAGTTTIQARGKPIAAYRRYRLGQPRSVHIALVDPPVGPPAKERAVWFVVDNLDFP